MTTVETYKSGEKKVTIMKVTKPGTKKDFFFPVTDGGQRLNTVLYARKYDAVALGKMYLNK